ncbi:MAG TPA: CBS domain-containing protein [Candidatus Limnocylindria bacterium]|nr:CBS domain-containing protein [Candidatus Limnocylindria bacterium]
MICPVCGHENLQGVDECENCGSDLRTSDIPAPSNFFERWLVNQPLSALNAARPLTVTPDTGLADAVSLLQAEDGTCLVVEQDGQVRGILTERDLLLRAPQPALDGTRVGELMTSDPVVLRPDDSIAVAIHKMAVGGFRHVPLVEDGRATAVVSAGDVFRYILDVID